MALAKPELSLEDKQFIEDQSSCVKDDFEYELVTRNFLRLSPENVCEQTIQQYGVGACGPRGFYGTFDVHVYLEKEMAKFLDMEATLLYPSAFSAITSVIPAFATRDDLLVCDDGIAFPLQQAILLSGARLVYFRHNDMESLKEMLQRVSQEQRYTKHKRYIICEGLYQNWGDIAPLREINRLRNEYKIGLMLDECHSFGVLGDTGRGLTEHVGLSASSVDLMIGSVETVLGSNGGWCAGNRKLINHQTLNGSSYCFSAAVPMPLVAAARKTLSQLDANGAHELKLLRECIETFDEAFKKGNFKWFKLRADVKHSPIKHIVWNGEDSRKHLRAIITTCQTKHKIHLTVSRYSTASLLETPAPSICLALKYAAITAIKPLMQTLVQYEQKYEQQRAGK